MTCSDPWCLYKSWSTNCTYLIFLYSCCLEVAHCLWVFHSVESMSVLLFLSFCCQQSIIHLQKSSQSSIPSDLLWAALAQVLQGSLMPLVHSSLSQWGCRGNPNSYCIPSLYVPKIVSVSLWLCHWEMEGSWGGEGCGFPSLLKSAQEGWACSVLVWVLPHCLLRFCLGRGFSYLASLFGVWVFSLISERLQLKVLSCLKASSIGACPLPLTFSTQPSRAACEVTPAQTHCLTCSCLSPADRKAKSLSMFLVLTEFPSTIRACQLLLSAELGNWRSKQGGEGRLTPVFSLSFKPCTQGHPQHFGSLFVLGSPRGLAVLYLVIIDYYFLVVAVLIVSKLLLFYVHLLIFIPYWWKGIGWTHKWRHIIPECSSSNCLKPRQGTLGKWTTRFQDVQCLQATYFPWKL